MPLNLRAHPQHPYSLAQIKDVMQEHSLGMHFVIVPTIVLINFCMEIEVEPKGIMCQMFCILKLLGLLPLTVVLPKSSSGNIVFPTTFFLVCCLC